MFVVQCTGRLPVQRVLLSEVFSVTRKFVAPKPSASGIHVIPFQSDTEYADFIRRKLYVDVMFRRSMSPWTVTSSLLTRVRQASGGKVGLR